MKVVYIFSTANAGYILDRMILPQLENGTHPVTVSGAFFFVDNTYLLLPGTPTARRLAALQREGTLGFAMGCDQCCDARGIRDAVETTFETGCFPALYARAGEFGVDQVITL